MFPHVPGVQLAGAAVLSGGARADIMEKGQNHQFLAGLDFEPAFGLEHIMKDGGHVDGMVQKPRVNHVHHTLKHGQNLVPID